MSPSSVLVWWVGFGPFHSSDVPSVNGSWVISWNTLGFYYTTVSQFFFYVSTHYITQVLCFSFDWSLTEFIRDLTQFSSLYYTFSLRSSLDTMAWDNFSNQKKTDTVSYNHIYTLSRSCVCIVYLLLCYNDSSVFSAYTSLSACLQYPMPSYLRKDIHQFCCLLPESLVLSFLLNAS